jgi:hypothetical protein
MNEKFLIQYGNIILYIDRYIYESDEMFYYRINYIYNNINKNNIDDLIGLSKLECQKKFNHCNY